MKGLPYHSNKIGQCFSCLRKECVNPSHLRNHPEQGCSKWSTPESKRLRKSLPFWSELSFYPVQGELF